MKTIKPIFITGIYRSGTTLISRILNNHPDLSITYDSVHFMRFSYNKFNPIHNQSNYFALIREVKHRIQKRWELDLDTEKVINKIKKNDKIDYSVVYDSIMLTLLLEDSNAMSWGEKTNVCWSKIPDFLSMFPEGKAILMIRDPRDILVSYKKFTTEPGLRYLDSVFACLDSFHTSNKYLEKLDHHNFQLILYENLVKNPKEVVQSLCKFLEIKFDPIMLESEKFKDKSGNEWKANSSFDNKMNGISNTAVSRWRDKISNVELYFVEMVLREQMRHYGYELGAVPLSKNEWDDLFQILNDDFIRQRYSYWLKTGRGHEKYPNEQLEMDLK